MSFPSMIDLIPEGQKVIAKVEHYEVSEFDSLRSVVSSHSLGYCAKGRYARLLVNGQLVMSDTGMEKRSNLEVCYRANGRVLVAGLGLGLILTRILAKPEVNSVLVVEKEQDVIDLIKPHFRSSKLKVVCADILEWKPEKNKLFDTIYFDIWAEVSTDDLATMAKLHRRFCRFLNRDNQKCWMGSWQHSHLLRKRRHEKACGW